MNPGALVFDGALWLAIPIALAAGLISFLSPCVLPLVPGYLGFIGGAVAPRGSSASTAGRGRLLGGTLLFIAGFTVVFMALNVLGGAAGAFFTRYGDVITRVVGVVIILMGLVFIGLFGIAQRSVRMQARGNLGLIGAPLLGIALGVGWTPCIGPTLTAIISVSYIVGDPWRAAMLGLAYSLGLGIPFILLALGFGWATRSVAFIRKHIRLVNLIGGALLIVLGLLMVVGVWGTWMSTLQGVMLNVQLPL
ncbi:cytochrome c biogenesis protein CcdA [Microbacterium sp. NPDC086615]|uniref:cytochrome c biogenesis CcdA family protein n=1 Tax=Microbacterium sp. NPDC086615 TaxID=3154865 RepID=UPI00342CE7C5